MSYSQSWGIRDYWGAIYRYKGRAVLFCILTVALGVAWIFYGPRQFESESKLFVRVGWENATLDPLVNKRDAMAVNISRETEISTMMEHLRSRHILEKTLAIVKPSIAAESDEERELAFNRFRKRVSITSPRTSMIIKIVGKGDSPAEAQKTVSTLTDLYLDDHLQMSRPAGSYEFLKQHSNRLREEFEAAQEDLREAKNRGGLASMEGRRTALENQINVLESRIHEVSAALSGADAKMASLKAAIDPLPEPLLKQMIGGTPNDGIAMMRDRLFQLQVQQEEVRSKLNGQHPQAEAIRAQVKEITDVLKRENPERAHLLKAICATDNASQAALSAQKQALEKQLEALRKDVKTLNEDEMRITHCALLVRQCESKYLDYAGKTEDARIESAMLKDKISNVRVIQPASFSAIPIGPQKATVLLLAVMCGVAGGIGITLLSEQWARSGKPGVEIPLHHRPSDHLPSPHLPTRSGGNLQNVAVM